jgi:primosomal protein N' (replication factor Y)
LFDLDPEPVDELPDDSVPVRVLPDVSGFEKEFDYLLTEGRGATISIGDQVRIELKGRQVGGWITGIDLDRPPDIALRPVSRVVSAGPSADVVDLARWASRRWGGRLATILKTASPPRRVPLLGPPSSPPVDRSPPLEASTGVDVFRFGPDHDLLDLLIEAAQRGNALVIAPRLDLANALAGRLRRHQVPVRVHPRDWAQSAHRGGVVIGARSAVWARVPDLATVVVLDEHDEALQEERNPTWHARDVAIERARRAGAACWLVSSCPSVVALQAASRYHEPSRRDERAAWPIIEVVDRRDDEPGRGGLFSERVVETVRQPGRVLCVLNRKGRAVMLACSQCGDLVLTEDGERLMVERDGHLVCPSTGEVRPVVCANCGATRLKRLRLGVARAAEELAALAGEPVDELSGPDRRRTDRPTRVVVGTEAALHQLAAVERVVFLDFDQELLAPRYRAGEQAMGLLILAARLVGGRAGEGGQPVDGGARILIQTRTPQHRVLAAAVRADPASFARAELDLRHSLDLPPFAAVAELSGKGAPELGLALDQRDGIDVLGPRHDGRYLVKAATPDELAAALAETPRPELRVRVAVDPPRA